MTSGSSVRHLFNQVYKSYADGLNADPKEIADIIASRVPEAELRLYFRDALTAGSVYTLLAKKRRDAVKGFLYTEEEKSSAEIATLPTKRRKKAKKSWDEILRQMIPVEGGGFKYMRDATKADLEYQVATRTDKAKAIMAEAHTWQRFADTMEEYGVQTFGLLPADAILRN